MKLRGRLFLSATGLLFLAGVAQSQPAASQWEVRSSPAIDLWYYGLASVGFSGPGTLSWYNADFAAALRAEQRNRTHRESILERDRVRFASAFRGDTIFEALHFLPLYYAGDDGSELIATLRSLSVTGNPLARVFPASQGRKVLERFADALDAERPYLPQSEARAKLLDAKNVEILDARWKTEFLPVLFPYFRELGIRRGVILISPAIGSEGRIVRNGDEAVVAVGTTSSLTPAGPLYEAVRELCFPLVNRVAGVTTASMSMPDAIDATNRAAVRCGAMLLDVPSTKMGAEYRGMYVGSVSANGNVALNFDAQFPLSKAVEKSLREEVERVMSKTRSVRR